MTLVAEPVIPEVVIGELVGTPRMSSQPKSWDLLHIPCVIAKFNKKSKFSKLHPLLAKLSRLIKLIKLT